MIIVYYLPVETIDGSEEVIGSPFIHDALLLCTNEPDIRKLIMDTTAIEHNALVASGAISDSPTQAEIDLYNAQVVITPPHPDVARAQALLATSPSAITMPDIWELLRIFGRLHGVIT